MDEYETKCQTKLDTTSKMTVLKILIGPRVTGDKFGGAEHTQDEIGFQETRKHVHDSVIDSQSTNGPAPMEINSTVSNREEVIGEAQPRAEGTDLEEAIASLVGTRERKLGWTQTVKEGTITTTSPNEWNKDIVCCTCGEKGHIARYCRTVKSRGTKLENQWSNANNNRWGGDSLTKRVGTGTAFMNTTRGGNKLKTSGRMKDGYNLCMIGDVTRQGTLSTVRCGRGKETVRLLNHCVALSWLQDDVQAVEDFLFEAKERTWESG